jgi:hypothetical protein
MNDLLLKLFAAWGVPKRKILYEYARLCIGKDMSFNAPDEVGCADAVNEICRRALGFPVGGGVSTTKMYQALQSSLRWKRVANGEPGDIVISPSGYGNGSMPNGHVGIVAANNGIMSNNSYTGKWEENYTKAGWRARYVDHGGFPMAYYRLIA